MSATQWITDLALILVVFRQLRERPIDRTTVIIPAAVLAYVGDKYLRSIPTGGNDLVLLVGLGVIGLALGVAGGLLTRVRFVDGRVRVKATWSAAAVWVVGIGARLAFSLYAQSSSGAHEITRLSVEHHITSLQAWVNAVLVMVLLEVVSRIGLIIVRGRRLSAAHRVPLFGGHGDAAGPATRSDVPVLR